MSKKLQFYFGKLVVGYFEEESYPRKKGRYKYMPFRGPGHYNLHQALKVSSGQKCYYEADGYINYFCVVGCPEKGIIELAEFKEPHEEGI